MHFVLRSAVLVSLAVYLSNALRGDTKPRNCSMTFLPLAAARSLSFFHSSLILWRTVTKFGRPIPAALGPAKYVPPKIGSKSGVRKTLSGHPPWPVDAWTKVMYIWSMSGLSSLSTEVNLGRLWGEPLILTKSSLSKSATCWFSNDSLSITFVISLALHPIYVRDTCQLVKKSLGITNDTRCSQLTKI